MNKVKAMVMKKISGEYEGGYLMKKVEDVLYKYCTHLLVIFNFLGLVGWTYWLISPAKYGGSM